MEKQIIITIGREFGSQGHEIADKVAEDLGFPLYDRNLLDHIAEEKGIEEHVYQKYDEKPRNVFLTRSVGEHTNSMEKHLADMQFEFIKKKADAGESFVVVGRCANSVLSYHPGLISIFILGDREFKINHVKEKFGLSRNKALDKMNRHDKSRKYYHNRHSKYKWGDSRGYTMCLNSTKLGIEGTARVIENFVEEFKKK